jgi:uncharacterized protein YjcR
MEKKEKVFAKGFIFKKNENAPEWVVGRLSLKKDEAIAFIQSQGNEWINLNIVRGQQGKFYVELDTWKPTNQSNPSSNQSSNVPQFKAQPNASDDLPF